MSNKISETDRLLKENAKKAAGYAAAELAQDGMVIGLGTGTTVKFFIEALIDRCHNGLKIAAVASSKPSYDQASSGNIPFVNLNDIYELDLVVDGADEIDPSKRMIKGGGGALLREKIIASSSKEMIVIVDENKLVENLGGVPLPVEIVSFGYRMTLSKLEMQGYQGELRKKDGKLFVTENNNYIYDVHFPSPLVHPEKEHQKIISITGVVETGFFFNLAGRVVVGLADGKVKIFS